MSYNFCGHLKFGFEIGRCYAILLYRQMLLPWQMLLPYDIMVDVIALADVVAIHCCGRCYNH